MSVRTTGPIERCSCLDGQAPHSYHRHLSFCSFGGAIRSNGISLIVYIAALPRITIPSDF